MKKIELEQGSKEWLSWRKTVITGTDAPAILGSSPWVSAYQCWQRKLGLIPEVESNAAMERGKRLEPLIRDRFIKKYSVNMIPVVIESSEYNFLGASLDGISEDGHCIIEIKAGGDKLYQMALQGKIPDYYMDQIQLQLLVSGADECLYIFGDEDGTRDVVIQVLRDPEFEEKFIPIAKEFLRCVAFCESPPLKDSDYKDMSSDDAWVGLSQEYKDICASIDRLENEKKEYRKKLIELAEDHSCIGGGLKVMKTFVRGRVDYDSIPEIQGVMLDKYRKASSTCWKILVS